MALAATRQRLARSRDASSGLALALERRLGLTLSGAGFVGLVVAGYYLATRVHNRAMFLLTYGLAFVVLTAFVLGRRRLAVEAERSQIPLRVREGQTVQAELTLRARRRVSTIVLEEELHPLLGATVRLPVPTLPGGDEVRHPYRFSPRLRGVYTVGPLVALWSDPFGLTKTRTVLAEPTEIIVHPATEPVHDRVLSRAWEDPPIRPPVSKAWPTGFEFYGMQDYQQGDDPRRIVWRATARTLDTESGAGRYLVRVAEQGITDRVSVIFDTDRDWHAPGERSETFESAVRVVASIGASHLQDGFAVTLDTNQARVCHARRGVRHRIPLLDELARAEREDAPLTDVLERYLRDPARDTHIVIVTPHLEHAAATRVRMLMDRGVSILLALVLCDDSDPASLHRAGSLGCNVVEVVPGVPLAVVFDRIHAVGGRR